MEKRYKKGLQILTEDVIKEMFFDKVFSNSPDLIYAKSRALYSFTSASLNERVEVTEYFGCAPKKQALDTVTVKTLGGRKVLKLDENCNPIINDFGKSWVELYTDKSFKEKFVECDTRGYYRKREQFRFFQLTEDMYFEYIYSPEYMSLNSLACEESDRRKLVTGTWIGGIYVGGSAIATNLVILSPEEFEREFRVISKEDVEVKRRR